jgi:hypothetical protein
VYRDVNGEWREATRAMFVGSSPPLAISVI